MEDINIKLSNYNDLSEDTNEMKENGVFYLLRPKDDKYEYIRILYKGGLRWIPWILTDYVLLDKMDLSFEIANIELSDINEDDRIFTPGTFIGIVGINEDTIDKDYYYDC